MPPERGMHRAVKLAAAWIVVALSLQPMARAAPGTVAANPPAATQPAVVAPPVMPVLPLISDVPTSAATPGVPGIPRTEMAQAIDILRGKGLPDNALWIERLDLDNAWQSREYWNHPLRAGRNGRGGRLALGNTVYAHGLGTLAICRLAIDLKGAATRFVSVIGTDKAAPSNAGTIFEVWVDGKKVVDTGAMRAADQPKLLSVDLQGAQNLLLESKHASVSYASDMGNWGGAMLLLQSAAATALPETVAPPDMLLDKAPLAPGNHYVRFPWTLEGRPYPGRYSIFLPGDYRPGESRKYPLILFLHGKGEMGPMIERVCEHGTPRLVQSDPEFRKKFGFIVLTPQINGVMGMEEARAAQYNVAVLDEVCKRYPVDTDRIYVTGFSFGGTGSWRTAIEFPDRFAAAAPFCGRAIDQKLVDPQIVGKRLKDLPIWAVVGSDDRKDGDDAYDFTNGNIYMVKLLMRVGANIRFTLIPHAGHDIWDPYYGGDELYKWLLGNTRGHPGPRIPSDADKY